MGTIGSIISLGAALCGVLLVMLVPSFFLSIPGWAMGWIAARNSPRLRAVRRSSVYWAAWVLLGALPLAVSTSLGVFAGADHTLSFGWTMALNVLGVALLNTAAFHIGYRQSLASKARHDVREALRPTPGAPPPARDTVDWFDENHPAVTAPSIDDPTMTKPLPVIDSHHDEYPTARPFGN